MFSRCYWSCPPAVVDRAPPLSLIGCPAQALTFLREFILGDNPTGRLLEDGTVVGGTNATLVAEIVPAERDPIFFGAGTTQGATVYPAATIAAWDSFTATAEATAEATYA